MPKTFIILTWTDILMSLTLLIQMLHKFSQSERKFFLKEVLIDSQRLHTVLLGCWVTCPASSSSSRPVAVHLSRQLLQAFKPIPDKLQTSRNTATQTLAKVYFLKEPKSLRRHTRIFDRRCQTMGHNLSTFRLLTFLQMFVLHSQKLTTFAIRCVINDLTVSRTCREKMLGFVLQLEEFQIKPSLLSFIFFTRRVADGDAVGVNLCSRSSRLSRSAQTGLTLNKGSACAVAFSTVWDLSF